MEKLEMKRYGLTEKLEAQAESYEGLYVGRVINQSKAIYRVICEEGEVKAEVSGKLRFNTFENSDYPAVGDFVMMDRLTDANGNAIIHHILPRKSAFIRKAAGKTHNDQVVASNIDTVFICMSMNNDFNIRRLERYISVAWESGAVPVVVLTKSDLCEDIEGRISETESVAIGVDIVVTSSFEEDGFQKVLDYVKARRTVAFIGSSGVGKSTLINKLIGETVQVTNGLRNDDKGRHTTTSRELILLENGAMVIDTPGMRELGIMSADFNKSFEDIDELAAMCKFSDCTHTCEPGCAVQKAIADGELDEERLESYRKLLKEAKYEGLSSRKIEETKITDMFSEFGGVKNARKYVKQKNKRRY